MKIFTKFFFFTLLTLFLSNSASQAQQTARTPSILRTPYGTRAIKAHSVSSEHAPFGSFSSMPNFPLSPDVALPPGLDSLPIRGSFALQSDGRPLHNVQIDPSNPLNIHVVITDVLDPSAADTATLYTRRCFYTFSSDGGMTWKPPVTFSTVRTGYADMQLFQRNGKYVPAIIAHRVTVAKAASLEVGLWIQKDDGTFSESLAPRITAAGTPNQDIAWPTMAMSVTNDTAFVVATVNPSTSGGASDQLQFGRFILNAAHDSAAFDGDQWDAMPGAGDVNNSAAGIAGAGGAARIRVAPSGKIGVAWVNDNNNPSTGGPDDGIYFAESTDGGKTWPSTLNELYAPNQQNPDANGNFPAPIYGGVDLWYNGENPQFMFLLGATQLGKGTYYPTTASVAFYDPAVDAGQVVNVISPYFSNPFDAATFEQSDSTTNSVRMFDPAIGWATMAHTSDPNQFAIFYQTYVYGDTELVNTPSDPTLDSSYCFASIYYQTTMDGGTTWSSAIPLLRASSLHQWYDYRQPMTSDFNPMGAVGPNYKIVASIDTAPGNMFVNGTYGFDLHYYALATAAVSAVNSQPGQPLAISIAPVFPNPVAASANIQFSVPNGANVVLTVSDMLGRTVRTLVSGHVDAGTHTIPFSTAGLSNGVYRYTLQADGASVSRSMSIMR